MAGPCVGDGTDGMAEVDEVTHCDTRSFENDADAGRGRVGLPLAADGGRAGGK